MLKGDLPTSVRLRSELNKRLCEVIAASDNNYSRSDIINLALEAFFAQLEIFPSILPDYNQSKDDARIQK